MTLDIVQHLRERQAAEGLSDAAFARRLGLPRQTWEAAASGERVVGKRTLAKVIRTYPELTAAAIAYLVADLLHLSRESDSREHQAREDDEPRLLRGEE